VENCDRTDEKQKIRWKNAPGAAQIERNKVAVCGALFHPKKDSRDQIAAKDKKKIDAGPEQRGVRSMGGEHHENRHGAETIKLRNMPHGCEAMLARGLGWYGTSKGFCGWMRTGPHYFRCTAASVSLYPPVPFFPFGIPYFGLMAWHPSSQ